MRRTLTLLCLPLSALVLAGCGSTAASAGFTGAKHEVAQTIANLQNDATAAESKKICANDLAASVVSRLGGGKRCETAIKDQLTEVDNLETKVKAVQLAADGRSASAQVSSIREGKTATSTVALVKEGAKWKIAGLG
jgi:outer membrane murein-binding lipoprotein Lpp